MIDSGDGVSGLRKFPMLLHCSFSDMSRVEFQTPAVIAGESDRVRDSSMVDAASHGDAPALILARKRGDVSEAWLYSKQ